MSNGTSGQPAWRRRVTEAAEGLFSHAPDPLADTFSHPGDAGNRRGIGGGLEGSWRHPATGG